VTAGLLGRLFLIVITVTAAAGGFTLGYLVGRNTPSAAPQPVIEQTIQAKAGGSDNRPLSGEARTVETALVAPEQMGSKENPSAVALSGAPAQEQRSANMIVSNEKAQKTETVEQTMREKRVPSEAAGSSNKAKEDGTGDDAVLYTVQVGAFKSRKEADTVKNRLADKEYKADIRKVTLKGKHLFKVTVGEFSQRKEAEVLAVKLKKTEGLKAFVTTKS